MTQLSADPPPSLLARARRRAPHLLRENQNFRRYWLGQSISLFGDQVTTLALPLVAVLVLHAGPAEMGYLVAAHLAPFLFFSLHAGAWVDRRGRRRQVMIGADLGQAALLASIPIAYAFDALTLAQVYAIAFATGTLAMLFFVAQSAVFVALTPREHYLDANSLLYGSRAFSFVAGPSVAGALVQVISAPFALVVDACSFIWSAWFLRSIDPVEPPASGGERGHIVAGVKFIKRSRTIRSALGATATINFFNFAFFALLILYATRYLHVRPGALGLVLGAGAVGGLIGSGITSRLGRRIGIGPTFVVGCILFPVPLVLVPAAGGPHWLVLAFLFLAEFGSGLGVMILDISAGTIFAAVIPNELRSRVSGAYLVVNNGIRPLGSLFGGALGSAIGVRETLWIATLGAIAGFLWLVPSPIPRMRELPDQPEAASV